MTPSEIVNQPCDGASCWLNLAFWCAPEYLLSLVAATPSLLASISDCILGLGSALSATGDDNDMANEEQLAILRQGVEVWNEWRGQNTRVVPNLVGAHLRDVNLRNADLREARLRHANLAGTDLSGADLSGTDLAGAELWLANLAGADLTGASLWQAELSRANLSHAFLHLASLLQAKLRHTVLTKANLTGANLAETDLTGADLTGAYLTGAHLAGSKLNQTVLREADLTSAGMRGAILIDCDLSKATLDGCEIFGISAWKLNLEGANQKDLLITDDGEPVITVDNLEVAQFIYLLLNNTAVRNVIDTITSKAVLILGRFTEERKAVLDALRDELRRRNYLPILFDFEKPSSRNFTETVTTLAHLARFVIADLTEPNSVPHELRSFANDLRSVPVQPIILRAHRPYPLLVDFPDHVLPAHEYETQEQLIAELADKVIQPAEDKVKELRAGGK